MVKKALILTALLTLHGCSSIINASTDSPIQQDRGSRTWGSMIDDETTETTALVNIKKADPNLSDAHIAVTRFNGVVLLLGQAPTNHAKQTAEKVVQSLRKVRTVYNEIIVAGPISLPARSNDSWLTTKAKSKLLAAKGVPSGRIKVVTENGVIYLMGLVSRQEAQLSVNAISNTYGAQKIVQVFEYIN